MAKKAAKKKTSKRKKSEKTPTQIEQIVGGGNGSGGNGVSAEAAASDPEGLVLQLTTAELDRFNALRLKAENTLQAVRVLELEEDKAIRAFRDEQHNRQNLMAGHREAYKDQEQEYLAFVRKLGKKYELDPNKMGVDDETGALTDLRDLMSSG